MNHLSHQVCSLLPVDVDMSKPMAGNRAPFVLNLPDITFLLLILLLFGKTETEGTFLWELYFTSVEITVVGGER